MEKKDFFIALLAVILVAFVLVGAKCTSDYREEIARLQENLIESNEEKDSTSVTTLTAKSTSEFKTYEDKQVKKALDKLDVKESKVKYITETVTRTKFDTILYLDTIYKHDTLAQCFSYIDKYISLGGEVINGRIDFDLQMADSLTLVCHKKKKKFLFIPYYSRKELETEITNMNPYCKIIYAKEIKVE